MAASLMLSWREGVSAGASGDGGLRVEGHGARVVLRPTAPAVAGALLRLDPPGEDRERLADSILDAGGPAALAGWYYTLGSLARRGLVCWSVRDEGRRIATLVPISTGFATAPARDRPGRRHLLSRFAHLRRDGDGLILESPLAHARVILDDGRVAALIAALATPKTAPELVGRAAGLPDDSIPLLLDLLADAGMIREVGPDGGDAEEESPSLASWEFHDLLFHARSRKGRSDAPFGATYRMAGRLEPPPALKPDAAGQPFDLDRPDLDRFEHDPPLAQVVEQRRSIRAYGDRPITSRELGEFLYRVARIKDDWESEAETPRGPVSMAFASRPYPSGGALYELEFYAVVAACDGLGPGLYSYEPRRHRLIRTRGLTDDVEPLLRDASASAGIRRDTLQVLLILAARYPRLSWKYSSIAYALVLKHVGVVYQTMYLAATAMGLAPCALGGGDSDAFARAAGADYAAETSVGEFLLGSR